MKESDFFKQLNRELQDAAPPLSERLKEEPICSALREKSGDGRDSRTRGKTAGRVSKKRLTAILASAAALILVCIVGLTAFFLGPSVSPTVYACMYIDINPSLALTLDENYNVRKVVSRNADADTLIGDESFVSSLTGLSAQEAAVKVAERAAKSGYLSLRGSGSKDDYNEIGVTVRSNAAVKEETLNSIEEKLVGFFCENGVYVYVNARSETDLETASHNRALESRPVSYLRWTADSQSLSELERLVEDTIYGYAADLLTDALYKYDLFARIEALNRRIKEDPENLLNLGYWLVNAELNESVHELSAEMAPLLEELNLLYGVDCRERSVEAFARYTATYTAYQTAIVAADVDSLGTLLKNGISEATFGGIENFSVRLNYFYFVSNDLLNKIATEIWNGAALTAEKLLSDAGELIKDRAAALTERYSALFSLEREPIDEKAYARFLERIGK